MTSVAARMVSSHPQSDPDADIHSLTACIEACMTCAQACANAGVAEPMVAELPRCIRLNADCADLCWATARLLSRRTAFDAGVARATLEACATACAACAGECQSHAAMHEHCRVCADACRACERACRDLLATLG